MSSPSDGTFTGIRATTVTCAGDAGVSLQSWTPSPNAYTGFDPDDSYTQGYGKSTEGNGRTVAVPGMGT